MKLVSNSFSSGFRPGCIYEEDDSRALAQIAQGHAAPVGEPAQPPKPPPPPPVPEVPEVVQRARDIKPWPTRGPRPERFIELYPNSKKVALALEHIQLEKDLAEMDAERRAAEAEEAEEN